MVCKKWKNDPQEGDHNCQTSDDECQHYAKKSSGHLSENIKALHHLINDKYEQPNRSERS